MIESISTSSIVPQDNSSRFSESENETHKNDSLQGRNVIIFMTLIASSFGVSSMGLSSICARSGLLLYVILTLLAGMINYCSFLAFVHLTSVFKLGTFQDLAQVTLGRMKILIMLPLIVSNLGNMVGNLLIFTKYFQGLFRKMGLMQVEPGINENMTQILLFSLLLFPLLLKRQLKDIFFVTYLTILTLLFFSFFSIFEYFQLPQEKGLDAKQLILFEPSHFVSNYSYLFFCFAGQQGVIIIYNENNQKGVSNMKRLIKGFFLLMTAVYLVFGIFGYLTFSQSQEVSELTYLALFKNNSSLILIAQTSMLVTCIVAYIFLFKPTRDLIETYVLGGILTEKKEKEFGF